MTITDSRFGLRYSSSHGSEDVVNDSRHKPAAYIWQVLGPLTAIRSFPKGAKLFPQGRPAKGVFVIEQGEVKAFLSADPKLSQPFDVPGPGSVLGLSESVPGREYKVTAQAADPIRAAYIEREKLMHFLSEHCDICMQIVQLLSEDLHVLYHKFRSFGGTPVRGRGKSVAWQ
jgi:CRP-like cAMP-binding protein